MPKKKSPTKQPQVAPDASGLSWEGVAEKTELADLKERAKTRAAEEKARMANMFAAGGKSLYADKEEEREQKAREAEAKKKREAEAAAAKDAKLHEDWDKECERREAASEARASASIDARQPARARMVPGKPS